MTIDEMIEVLQACKEGKTIQFLYRSSGQEESWRDIIGTPIWEFSRVKYRVKLKEPREIWVNQAGGALLPRIYISPECAKGALIYMEEVKQIKFREVLE